MPSKARRIAKLNVRTEERPLAQRVFLPAQRFLRVEERSGGPLLLAAAAALAWANLPAGGYESFWGTDVSLRVGSLELGASLRAWIRDLLLPLFFFVIGLEIKQELKEGELSSARRAALPVATAIGGMVVPALVYLAFNLPGGQPHGWGVPVATDIAFALAILAILGPRVPNELKVLVVAFATADDVAGVIVIAVAYSHGASLAALGVAAGILGLMFLLRVLGLRSLAVHGLLGLGVLLVMKESGVHATIGGVLLGFLAPVTPRGDPGRYADRVEELAARYREARAREQETLARAGPGDNAERAEGRPGSGAAPETGDAAEAAARRAHAAEEEQDALLGEIEELTTRTESPADMLLRRTNPWVSYLVLPLFALSHAGVALDADSLREATADRAALGVFAALVVGKPIGVFGFGWIAERLGWAERPKGVTWRHVAGVALLAGIGFTVSLFIAELAFGDDGGRSTVKIAVLAASVLTGTAAWAWLRWTGGGSGE